MAKVKVFSGTIFVDGEWRAEHDPDTPSHIVQRLGVYAETSAARAGRALGLSRDYLYTDGLGPDHPGRSAALRNSGWVMVQTGDPSGRGDFKRYRQFADPSVPEALDEESPAPQGTSEESD